MSRLEISEGQYVLDGAPYRIVSGAIHYFRVVPAYWEDRLLKLKACGFNTVETYIAWNVHEPQKEDFQFHGMADVAKFIELAGQLGLHVIVRPSPYICAEWEFGGLPAWLLQDNQLQLRCMDPLFLAKVDRYYDQLIPRLVPLLSTNGGPILAVQIENEYGSFGNDTAYLTYIQEGLVRRGIDVLLFTSDGPTDEMLIGGTIEGVHATVNFGSRVAESFAKFREYRAAEPLMVMEYWNGWFDHWMEPHHVREAADVAEVLDEMLEQGSSVNMYMFHGGTNFGYYSGANHIETYEPTVTSYDYDAPLTEWGDVTKKCKEVQKVLGKHGFEPGCPLPNPIPKYAYGEVALSESVALFDSLDQLSEPIEQTSIQPMEKFGQAYGFILYSTWVKGPRSRQQLHIQEVRDRAQVFLNGKPLGVVERWNPLPLEISVPEEGGRLDILVENMGRINYGPLLRDPKGITEGVRIDNQFQYHWTIRTLPLQPNSISTINYVEREIEREDELHSIQGSTPAFYRGYFTADQIGDTFLRFDGWQKGIAWVNGFHLGRYWNAGPQRALYVPGPLLRVGRNEIVLFELHGSPEMPVISLVDQPDLGITSQLDERVLNFVQDE
ncbi:beta-galactosidase [Paenibacillus selenitireducens]|uniref:Beta-galactosidase n=1 Tax=Paenibacillus selenitireducens TaxID=1324314 RepID=A0A1T2XEK9_9BACL|nr:beta-galactosidase family protein [Paenibacillus selenitireducens]OPA78319.1 beta-galactosidase [Paenibacillus selenitireducens]